MSPQIGFYTGAGSGTIRLRGFDELARILRGLPDRTAKKALVPAMRKSNRLIIDAARARVRRVSGTLARSIGQRIKWRRPNSEVVSYVGPMKPSGYYAHMVEFGTRPHVIRATKAKALFISGRWIERVEHPGAAPKPFLRPAFDEQIEIWIHEFGQAIGEFLEKEARTMGGYGAG